MEFPPLVIIGLIANFISVVIGTSLLLLIVWQGRHRTNLLFSLFLLAMIDVAGVAFVLRLSPFLEFSPVPWLYALSSGIGAYGVVLFIFASEFTGKSTPLAYVLYGVGMILWIFAATSIWSGRVLVNIQVPLDGRTLFDFTPLGYVLMGLLLMFEALALGSMLIKPTARSRALVPAIVIFILAALADLSPLIARLPVNSVMSAIAAIMIGQVVLKDQLFDPLTIMNRELAEANEELALASQLKSQFLANMSHELRTPLNSIIGYSELILEEMYGPITEKQRDRLEKVNRNGKSLLALINDILDISRIDAGKMKLSLEPVLIPRLIDQAIAEANPAAEEKGLTIQVSYPTALPRVRADEERLRQILSNLVSNAVKFTKEGSVLIEAVADDEAQELAIRVVDTGIGIPPESHELIFDEFRQADSTSTREYDGTGLGLALSRHLARMQQGEITVISEPGKGSTFTLRLPLDEEEEAESQITDPSGPLVLVIDDQPDAADLIRTHLVGAGYQVHTAQNGPDGLKLARELRPSVITLDLMMPEMDGWQVLEELRNDSTLATIPVLIVSIVDQTPVAFEMGARDYIRKPISSARLLDATRAALRSPTSMPILIVDDNPDARELMSTMLEGAGHRLQFASSGDDAIAWLKGNAAALVILDLKMPQVSGFEVLAYIRSESTQPDLPVIIVTSKELTSEEMAFITQRYAEVLDKPGLGKEKLLTRIERALMS